MFSNKYDEDFIYPSPSSSSSSDRNLGSQSVSKQNMPKYAQLLSVIEDMGKEVRTAYAGNKTSVERLKKGIIQAKHLVGECLIEAERSARSTSLIWNEELQTKSSKIEILLCRCKFYFRKTEMTSKSFRTLHIYDTDLYADSVEWCPIPPYRNSFVCGTYQLDDCKKTDFESGEKQDYHRNGTITLFTVIKNKLERRQTIKCPAVLDMKWCPHKLDMSIALATANADGEVCLFLLEETLLKFISKCSLKKESGDFLALSLDWMRTDSPDMLCASDSKGGIALIKVSVNSLTVLKEWKAHSLEAWIVCFDSFRPNIVYSGGDEGELKIWDWKRLDCVKIASSTKHTAGVTALISDLRNEFTLASGSYDETVLFWDTRNWKRPIGSINASGGVWRLKKDQREQSNFLLAACIYGGFEIYDIVSFSTVAVYKEHESLAYGADWCLLERKEVKNLLDCDECALIATCSFYDHKLCVSLWDENT